MFSKNWHRPIYDRIISTIICIDTYVCALAFTLLNKYTDAYHMINIDDSVLPYIYSIEYKANLNIYMNLRSQELFSELLFKPKNFPLKIQT